MRKALAIFVCMIAFMPVAHATEVPDSAKDEVIQGCMGGETAQQDPERAKFCQCMRDSVQNWSAEEFKEVADEAKRAHAANQEPTKLQELAKACVTKVLGPMPQ